MTTNLGEKQEAEKAKRLAKLKSWIANDTVNLSGFYPRTVGRECWKLLSRNVKAALREQDMKKQIARELSDHRELGQAVTYDYFLRDMDYLRVDLRILVTACDKQQEVLAKFRGLELMRFSVGGSDALNDADNALNAVKLDFQAVAETGRALTRTVMSAVEVYKLPVNGKTGDIPLNVLAGDRLDEQYVELMARATREIKDATPKIEKVAAKLRDTLTFQVAKAYAVQNPQKVQKMIDKANTVAKSTVSVSGVASSAVPDPAGPLLSTVNSVSTAVVAFIGKAAITWSNEREAAKLLSTKEGRRKVLAALDDDDLLVAKYLKDKYVANLKYNFDLLDPLAFGGSTLLSAGLTLTGAGATVGMFAGQLWPLIRTVFISTVDGMQDARLERAVAAKRQGDGEDAAADAATDLMEGMAGQLVAELTKAENGTWRSICDELAAKLPKGFLDAVKVPQQVLDTATSPEEQPTEVGKVAARLNNAALGEFGAGEAVSLLGEGTTAAIWMGGSIAHAITQTLMVKIEIKPAQPVTGAMIKEYRRMTKNTIDDAFDDVAKLESRAKEERMYATDTGY